MNQQQERQEQQQWHRVGKFVAQTYLPDEGLLIQMAVPRVRIQPQNWTPGKHPAKDDNRSEYTTKVARVYEVNKVEYELLSDQDRQYIGSKFSEAFGVEIIKDFLRYHYRARIFGENLTSKKCIIATAKEFHAFYQEFKDLPNGSL